MKTLFSILFLISFQNFNAMAQHSYTKEIILKMHDWKNKPISKTGSITFTVEGKVYKAKYNGEKSYYIFDSLPFVKGFLNIQCQGYEPQKYFMRPQKELVFQLGKTGSSYMVRDGLLYPYVKKGLYVQLHSSVKTDSIEKEIKPFFDNLSLSVNRIYDDRVVLIHLLSTTKTIKPQKYIGKLLKHPLVFDAGEVYIPGEFSIIKKNTDLVPLQLINGIKNEFAIQFENEYNLPNTPTSLYATLEERQRIIDKYKLKVGSGNSLTTSEYVLLTTTENSPGTATEVLKLLLLEPAVKTGDIYTFPFERTNDIDMR